MYLSKKRKRKRKESHRRKDRLIQIRVGEQLEKTIKSEAKKRRMTVSHLLRNVLEENFNIVDDVIDDVGDIATDSLGIEQNTATDTKGRSETNVQQSTRRVDQYNRTNKPDFDPDIDERRSDIAVKNRIQPNITDTVGVGKKRDSTLINSLNHIYAWNNVVLNQSVPCSSCNCSIEKGELGYAGLSDEPGHGRSWLCKSCFDKL